MTLEEDINKLKELSKVSDQEVAHIEADEILLKYVPDKIIKAYKKVPKWYA